MGLKSGIISFQQVSPNAALSNEKISEICGKGVSNGDDKKWLHFDNLLPALKPYITFTVACSDGGTMI
ncbi:MAG: hypothetical protein HOJ87_12755 [Rhodospirillaceae bacterium]|nr:hypothetical protein [Rhodospirillaceae bacterium]